MSNFVDFFCLFCYNTVMDFLYLVKTVIDFNCEFLKIPIPSVHVVQPSEFATSTTRAAVSNDGSEMLINRLFVESCPTEVEIWLTISHECRHLWQVKKADMFKDYRQSCACSVKDYNAQAEEVDAWAWAVIVLSDKFGMRPTLEKSLGDELWAQIEIRAQQIVFEKLY